MPDPRGARGRRYRLSALVAAAAASVLAGARSLTAITEWINDVPAWASRVLGFPPTRSPAPCPSRTPTPCAVCSSNSTTTPWTGRSEPSSPPAPPRPALDCGRSLPTARPCAARAPTPPGTSPCSPRWTTPVTNWPSARSPTRATRSPPSSPCWTAST
ncbi:transposase family protein [Streptomyces sp. LBL]|uniref:transposase family protein n=1 Tax=Streptomyces sp. LBL TaxID=2940562 RepID=UPI00247496EF|nr:transposase family protein [Streptomyces sp. LBL]